MGYNLNNAKQLILIGGLLPVSDYFLNTSVYYWYKKIKEMNTWDRQKIMEWQLNMLKQLLIHAYSNTSYYKNLFDEYSFNPIKISGFDDLKKLPALTKQSIQANYKSMSPSNLGQIKHKKAATGGSSGDPLRYDLDLSSWSYTTASNIISFQKQGLKFGEKYLVLGSSSLYPTEKKSLLHTLYYNSRGKVAADGVNMSDTNCDSILKIINKKSIRHIYGYASSIYLLAKYVEKNNLKVTLEAVMPTSEILTDEYREMISEVFQCKVMDGYGARDGGITADELTPGFYHVGYNSICSIANNDKNVGSLLLTDLLNYAFPFINYDIGDDVEMALENNGIYNGQLIKKVYGRSSFVIKLENGRTLTGPGFTILFKDINVVAYRIFKNAPLSITVEVQPNEKFTNEEKDLIIATLKKHAGSDCDVVFKVKSNFEPLANGKRLYFLN